ncbi:MAG TPA: NfeD family protein [Phycisphaerae bacterium]|nr:NfeD family protein [Phycisphaerae bacterium]
MTRWSGKRMLRLLGFAGVIALGLWGPVPAEEPSPEADAKAVRAARVPMTGFIDEALRTSVVRRAKDAVADGCGLIIFHITSNGGEAGAGLELSRDLERIGREGVRTVAFVDAKAYSAAALTALSCQEIIMTPEASIGDCAPILIGPQGVATVEGTEREKMESVLRERMESLAEKHGYPPALTRAMVTRRIVVIEAVNKRTGETRYIEEDELFGLGPDWEKGKTVDSADELLTVGSEKAKRYGIAKHVVTSPDELYDIYLIEGRIRVYAATWGQTLVLWLNNMYLKALLVLIGLLGLYVEMTTPGFGVPGTIGLVAFGLLFAASFLAGRPDWLTPLMFVVGLALLLVELFITPGFGVLGGLGILLLVGSIILALPTFEGLPSRDVEWSELGRAVAVTAGVLVAFAVCAFALARFFPRIPVLGKLALAPSIVSDGSSHAAGARQEGGVATGDIGETVSKLHPAGKGRFSGRLLDVVTEGDFLDAHRRIEVVRVQGNRIVVQPVEDASNDRTDA